MQQLTELASWIASFGRLCPNTVTTPMRVEITNEHWFGVHYVTQHEYQADMMACQRGDKQPGDKYTSEQVYLLGERPKVNQKPSPRHNKVCYRDLNGIDWYLATYMSGDAIKSSYLENHPFGASFVVRPWNLPEPIDHYERHPRNRDLHVPYMRYDITFINV